MTRSRLVTALDWFVTLAWPAVLVATLVMSVHHIDDGDPTWRFKSWSDVAFFAGIVAALTLEARKGFSWLWARLGRWLFGIPLALLALGCGLTAAQIKSIAVGGITLACSIAQPLVPRADASLTATVCQDAAVGAGVLVDVIEAGAADARGQHLVQPQGDAPPRTVGLTCRGQALAAMPASLAATLAQQKLSARPECATP